MESDVPRGDYSLLAGGRGVKRVGRRGKRCKEEITGISAPGKSLFQYTVVLFLMILRVG